MKTPMYYLQQTNFIIIIINILILALLQYLEPTRGSVVVRRDDRAGNETDYVALLGVRSQLTSPPAGIFRSWNHSFHHCSWDGVTCETNGVEVRVTALNLSTSQLVGTISPFIGNLSFLRVVQLSNNRLVGPIPPEIGRLFRLQLLSLDSNMLEGNLPANLSGCINLQSLAVGNNQLEGRLPLELSSLSKLEFLWVVSNNFTGPVFNVIANLTSLELIDVAYNAFTGSIPTSIGKMRTLKSLLVVQNDLSGTIPTSILNCSMLEDISVGGNNLQGELPPDIGLKLPHLVTLNFFINQFSGPFPNSVLNLTRLQTLDINANNFVGRVPRDLGHNLRSLEFLGLGVNYLEGDIDFVGSLVNCSNLEFLELSGNPFTPGLVLPESIANLSTGLQFLYLQQIGVTGNISVGIANLVNLEELILQGNQLTGFIPRDLGKLRSLQLLDLRSNKLTGSIPDTIKNLTRLSELYLSDNQLDGIIPPSLGSCTSLLQLNLSSNRLNGTIQDELFKGSAMFTIVDLSNNILEGSIPVDISTQTNLVVFDVSENKLSGVFPDGLADCSALQTIDIHANNIQGNIPTSFSSLDSLQTIDFSRNNLSGTIPAYFSTFPLQMLNLSYNNFEGEVPSKGVFSNMSAIVVDGNRRLCGGIPELRLPRCTQQPKETIQTKKAKHTRLKLMLCAFLVVVVIVIGLYLSYHYCRKKRVVTSSSSSSIGKEFMKVSYDTLLKATNGFSTENIVGSGGSGSVYRGDLYGNTIAVKVLNLNSRGADKSFMAECEALRNIRHRNLVGIMTTCCSIDFKRNEFKALVYEFMLNGSLDGWLHGATKKLSLIQRVNIAIDVAHALRYLHHDCEVPIVHCDLKPSNILLDKYMVARVADFGLAKFLPQPQPQPQQHPHQPSSTGLRGTIGYIAPEYGLGSEASPESDVYSYGILVLELMTGRRPTDNIFQEAFGLQIYAEDGLLPAGNNNNNVLGIVDPKLEDNNNEMNEEEEVENTREIIQAAAISDDHQCRIECMVCVISVGIACSKHSPQDRMKITDAICNLQAARDSLLCNATQTRNLHRH